MAYCVGNCLSWDEVSGNLTIKEDPLGGLECLPNGQRIRIAGGNTGVAVNAINNGLFMTAAGELATKVTPQLKNYATISNTQAVNAGAAGASQFGPYAQTAVLNMANPSPVYPMMVIANFQFVYDIHIQGVGSIQIHGRSIINGVSELHGSYHESQLTGSQSTRHRHVLNKLKMVSVPPSTSYTFQANQTWSTGNAGGVYYFYGATSIIEATGFIMQGVA